MLLTLALRRRLAVQEEASTQSRKAENRLTGPIEMTAKRRKLKTSHHAGVTWAYVHRQNLRPTRHLDAKTTTKCSFYTAPSF